MKRAGILIVGVLLCLVISLAQNIAYVETKDVQPVQRLEQVISGSRYRFEWQVQIPCFRSHISTGWVRWGPPSCWAWRSGNNGG